MQLFVPAQMIFNKQQVIQNGEVFRFKTAPIDPSDPFRGKYIILNFEENTFPVDSAAGWEKGNDAYLTLTKDSNNFAKVNACLLSPPPDINNFVKAKVYYIESYNPTVIRLQYPFEKFYLEESKAPAAEAAYIKASRSKDTNTYALVSVYKGDAALQDVIVNGKSVRDLKP